MSTTLATQTADACGVVTGSVTTSLPFDPAIDRSRVTWTAGDFGKIAEGYTTGAAAFVDHQPIGRGQTVLDLACGTGNLALPAARRGAVVTGVDIAENLIDAARAASAEASLDIRFDVGAAEALPYDDGEFDHVISMFGVMFAGRPEKALAELLRVTRPGGRIALANWTPAGFVGSMLRTHTRFVPPPAGAVSPLAWGDEEMMRSRLEPYASRVASLQFIPRRLALAFPLPPEGVVELFREFYGPTVRTFAALDAELRAQFASALTGLWASRNEAGANATSVSAEYMEVLIHLA